MVRAAVLSLALASTTVVAAQRPAAPTTAFACQAAGAGGLGDPTVGLAFVAFVLVLGALRRTRD